MRTLQRLRHAGLALALGVPLPFLPINNICFALNPAPDDSSNSRDHPAPGRAPAPAEEPSTDLPPTAEYRLGPGDVVEISVFEVEELSRSATLSPEGKVLLPLIGPVELGGLTAAESAARLRELYGRDLVRDPQITVQVTEYHSQPVAVLGAVAKPGVYQLRGARRLADVLALAGGLTPEAGGDITITRTGPGGAEQSLLLPPPGLAGPAESPANPWIRPRDTVRVPPAGLVFVVGEVNRAGGFPVKSRERMTVLKALSLAEGLRRTASPQHAKIMRGQATNGQAFSNAAFAEAPVAASVLSGPDASAGAGREQDAPAAPGRTKPKNGKAAAALAASGQQEIPVAVGDILAGRAPDPALYPGDILFIPNSEAKTAMGRAAEAAIQITTGVIIWRR